jgi:hypothetical protein
MWSGSCDRGALREYARQRCARPSRPIAVTNRHHNVMKGMNQFYIAMGQGVIAPADVEIFTETLLQCTFIAGYSAGGTRGGAFHYPAETLQHVGPVIEDWMRALRPVAMWLVFAVPPQFGTGTTASDRANLTRWFRERFPRTH